MSFRDPVVVTRVVRLVRPSLIALVTIHYHQILARTSFSVECTRRPVLAEQQHAQHIWQQQIA